MTQTLLSIVLPTRNRPGLLRRSLTFYARYGLSYPIAIADSSDPEYHADMDGLIDEFPQLSLNITRFAPDYNSWLKIIEVMEAQSTPYIGLSGDDDVLLNDSLTACVAFLQSHPEVSVVDGREVRVARPNALLTTNWGYSAVLHEQNQVMSPDPMSRLVQYFQSYWPTFYGVHRRDSVIEAFRSGHEMETENLVSELMQGATTVLNGTYRCLPLPYIVRQVYHNQSTAFDSWDRLVQSDEFASQVAYFRKRVQSKFPNDTRVPAGCDLAFERFLETMLPEYDFLASGVALEGGRPAQELADTLVLDGEGLREQAKVLTPPELRAFAARARKPALVSAAHMIVTHPDGMQATAQKDETQDMGPDLQTQLAALPPALAALTTRLCLDGFGALLRQLLHKSHGGVMTYQGLTLHSGLNHYTLPVLPECLLAVTMAQHHGAIPDCLSLITQLAHPDIDMQAILAFLARPRSTPRTPLDKAAAALEKDPDTAQAKVGSLLGALGAEHSKIEHAGLLALFAACCTLADQPDLASTAYAERLTPEEITDPEVMLCLLADMARVSFAALQAHVLVQHDWTTLLHGPALEQRPEGLFWAADYGGTLLGTGQSDLAHKVLERAAKSVQDLAQDPGTARAQAQVLYHLALLRCADDQTHDQALAKDAVAKAMSHLTAVHGPDHWMVAALAAQG